MWPVGICVVLFVLLFSLNLLEVSSWAGEGVVLNRLSKARHHLLELDSGVTLEVPRETWELVEEGDNVRKRRVSLCY